MKSFKRVLSFVVLPFAALALSLTSGIVPNNEHEDMSPWSTYMKDKDPADYFVSENPNYLIANSGGKGSIVRSSSIVAAVIDGDKTVNYTDFSAAINNWTDGSTLKLLNDVTGQLSVSSGTKTFDLNNHSLTHTSGSVVIVSGGTLNICDNSESKTKHYYTPNQTGVATLSGSETPYYFEGGYITGGNATDYRGGGLRVLDQGSVVFSSGTIFANNAGWGGGIWSAGSGSVTIEGSASIIGNYSSGAYTSGGGYFMEGSCEVIMTGGSIRHNSSQWSGGGVRDCIQESTGVRFTMTGGEITGNYANNNQGSGFCFDQATTFNIGGSARIINNQGSSDIYIYNDRYLTITSAFTEGAMIGVTLQSGTGTFTSGWSTYNPEGNPEDYFVSGNASYLIINNGGEGFVLSSSVVASVINGEGTTYYDNFVSAVSDWSDGTTLKLIKDVTSNSIITVDGGATKTLDLNGRGIKKTGEGRVISVINKSTLNINDSSPNIEHKFTVSAGLATVNDDLTSDYQTFSGGYITGGNALGGGAEGWGGALIVSMGGIKATLNMSGGTLIGNHCQNSGGAIRVGGYDSSGDTIINITGGAMMYNTAAAGPGFGGALTWEDKGVTVKISGGVIDNNFDPAYESNVYLTDGQKITVDSAIAANTSIGVRMAMGTGTITSGWSTYMTGEDASDYFVSDAGHYVYAKNGEVIASNIPPHVHSWTYEAEENVITAICAEDDCPLLANPTLTISAEDKTYDGTDVVATLTHSDDWTEENGLPTPEIVYSGNTNVGTYTASITLGDATASVEFKIKPLHEHPLHFEANGNVLTASCLETDCEFVSQSITINAEDKIYDGTPVVATLDVDKNWNEIYGMPEIPEIVYSGNTNVGTYTASITLGDATASVEFKISPDTNTDVDIPGDINVTGLNEEINALINDNPTANEVSLSMKIEAKEEETAEKGAEISEIIDNQVLCYFDITLEKTLDSVTTTMSETTTVLEIAFPYEKVNKRNIQVYAYHDDEIRTFVESDTKADGTFIVDKENQLVYVYTRSFSTYAIGYTPYYKLTADLSFGIFDGRVNVTLLDKNGDEAFKLEDVDAHNVKFNEVAMGTYKAIVTWADADVTTSLSFNLSIGPGGVVITPIANS